MTERKREREKNKDKEEEEERERSKSSGACNPLSLECFDVRPSCCLIVHVLPGTSVRASP